MGRLPWRLRWYRVPEWVDISFSRGSVFPTQESNLGLLEREMVMHSSLKGLVDYSAWGTKELNTTEQLTHNSLFNEERELV